MSEETTLLDYAMQIAHERELEVTGKNHDSTGAIERFNAAVVRAATPSQPTTKTHDLLSTLIGLFLGAKERIGAK